MNFSIYCRDDNYSRELKDKLISEITLRDHSWHYHEDYPDLVICIGGDGTILRAIHRYIDRLDNSLFVGVHTGTLGFLTDYTADETDEFLFDLLHKRYKIQRSRLLEIEMGSSSQTFYALNEIRLGNFSKTVYLDVYIDGEIFEHTVGSGLCICTQAGSTAANRALDGAVVDDGLEILQLVEIMPVSHKSHHSLKNPYIMKSDRMITITGQSIKECEAAYDHLEMDVSSAEWITVTSSSKTVRFARLKPYSYLKRLKNLY